jgi:hypothetical protein
MTVRLISSFTLALNFPHCSLQWTWYSSLFSSALSVRKYCVTRVENFLPTLLHFWTFRNTRMSSDCFIHRSQFSHFSLLLDSLFNLKFHKRRLFPQYMEVVRKDVERTQANNIRLSFAISHVNKTARTCNFMVRSVVLWVEISNLNKNLWHYAKRIVSWGQ